jgi:hypothetical protein
MRKANYVTHDRVTHEALSTGGEQRKLRRPAHPLIVAKGVLNDAKRVELIIASPKKHGTTYFIKEVPDFSFAIFNVSS